MLSTNKHYIEILILLNSMSQALNKWEVFYDFVELTAICISNRVDKTCFVEREEQYFKTIAKYSTEHQKVFPELIAQLVAALEYELATGGFCDILGCLFHELELHNKYKGQFFTPQDICNMMGKVLVSEADMAVHIQTKGYVTLSEPACGSGATVLGYAQAFREHGYNHSKQLLVVANDIDLKCVYMSYIQLSLYGIPAKITHENTLTMEKWSYWYTPIYVVEGFARKKQKSATKTEFTICS